MKILLKKYLFALLFLFSVNSVFSQDYYKLSQDFFKDTDFKHVNFVKKAIKEHNAEQLVIDYYDLSTVHDKDVEDINIKIKEIEDNFKANNVNPDDSYTCQKALEYRREAESASTTISYLKSSVNIAKNSYELCKNNVYRTGNCNQQLNNYNKQLNLYDNAVRKFNAAKDNYNYYRPDCNEIANDYENAANYAKRRIDNLIADQKVRINQRQIKFKSYEKQIRDIFLDTPMYTIEYYDNGNKHKEGYVDLKTNKYFGAFKKYYNNGNLELECVFKDGEYDGNYNEYYDTGIKKIEIVYDNGKVISRKEYNEEGVDEQAEMNKRIQEDWNEESAAINNYYETIDNSSLAENIAANPIRTIKEDGVELVIDFSKASKETVNFFLVRPEHERSKELRNSYIKNIQNTDGGKVSCKLIDDKGNIYGKAIYEGKIVNLEIYEDDGSVLKGQFYKRNRVGIWRKYDKNGKIIDEVDFDEQNKVNAFEYFSKN
ncbi:MAG: hypothetical protein JXK08_04455 [Flavobacteriaceae bacterium]|nr:hypothetical protein [Flavobacteriaceae bacterium]